MDKASRALRRSGAKLMSLGGSHGDLTVLLADLKEVKNTAKSLMNSQSITTQDMMKWASHQENRAVQDILAHIGDLQMLWVEVQKSFLEQIKEYRQVFEMILEGEKKVAQAKENLDYCEQKEVKVRKDLKRASKRDSASELRILHSKLAMAEESKNLAQIEVSDSLRENEAVKLIRLKDGMVKMSTAYVELGTKCSILYAAQRDMACHLPDVHGRELERIRYTGAERVRVLEQQARDKVNSYTDNFYQDPNDDPPPPYMPPDPTSHYQQPSQIAPPSGNRLGQSSSEPTPRRYSEPVQLSTTRQSTEHSPSMLTVTNVVQVRRENSSSDSSLSRCSSTNLSEGRSSPAPVSASTSQGIYPTQALKSQAELQGEDEKPKPTPRRKHQLADDEYETAEEGGDYIQGHTGDGNT